MLLRSEVVPVLKARTENRRSQKFAILLAIMDDPLLREASTEQFRQVLKASTVVEIYAAGDARVAQQLFTLYPEKDLSPLFLNRSTFLQRNVTKRKAVTKNSLVQLVPATTEPSLHFHGTAHVDSCLQGRRLRAKRPWKTGSRIGVAV